MAYGYRYGEVELPRLKNIKVGTRITVTSLPNIDSRRPAQVSLGLHVDGMALPHPDLDDVDTAIAGVRKRLAFRPPPIDPQRLSRFRAFVRRWVRIHLVPLDGCSDTSLEHWLEGTNYPLWRKEQLKDCWAGVEEMCNLEAKHYHVKSFMKDETYPEYKHGRGINSRTDPFKCAVGPIFKLIEQVLFRHDQFIKKVPVSDRPRVISERLKKFGAKYYCTDFTSYESLFVAEIMHACEFELYDYMTQALPEGKEFMKLMRTVLAGVNVCHWRRIRVEVPATRMSGEMCTSLGNGFTNLMLVLFLCSEMGTDVDGFVEGDDGIFVMSGEPPSSDDFASLGMVIKMETHTTLSSASFCGIIFDEDDLCNLTDPIETVVKFGYTVGRYACAKNKRMKMLLRCKALSLAHQYKGCPILDSLAHAALRLTRGVKHYIAGWVKRNGPAGLSMWDREQLLDAIAAGEPTPQRPGLGSRLLVEKIWHITCDEQASLEAYFDSLSEIKPLVHPVLHSHANPAWFKYWDMYVLTQRLGDDQIAHPRLSAGIRPGHIKEW